MRRLLLLLSGALLGGAFVYAAFQYHVVRTADGVLLVPKTQAAFELPYRDIRDWSAADWAGHPALARAMIAAGHGEFVQSSITSGLIRDVLGLRRSSAQETPELRRE